jgi:hypothetical protein
MCGPAGAIATVIAASRQTSRVAWNKLPPAAVSADVGQNPPMNWIAERRQRSRFEKVALPHLDAAYSLARWLTRNRAAYLLQLARTQPPGGIGGARNR